MLPIRFSNPLLQIKKKTLSVEVYSVAMKETVDIIILTFNAFLSSVREKSLMKLLLGGQQICLSKVTNQHIYLFWVCDQQPKYHPLPEIYVYLFIYLSAIFISDQI